MESYEVVRTVGKGAFAACLLVRRKEDGRELAIKRLTSPINTLNKAEVEDVQNELNMLSNLNHPNIVQYFGSFVHNGHQNIVMEYASGGTLQQVIRDAKGNGFFEEHIWEWVVQIILAMKYIHSRKILHRDLKTQNILLWGSSRRVVKVADFGIAKVVGITEHDDETPCVGTPYYLSPELWRGEAHTPQSDMWAFGCVVYELVSLRRPFDASTIPSLMLLVINGNLPELPTFANSYSKQLKDLLFSMLIHDAGARPDFFKLSQNTMVNKQIKSWESVCDLVIEQDGSIAQHDANQYLDKNEDSILASSTSDLSLDLSLEGANTESTCDTSSTSIQSNQTFQAASGSLNIVRGSTLGSISPKRQTTVRDRAILNRSITKSTKKTLSRTFTGTRASYESAHSRSKASSDLSFSILSLGSFSARKEAYRIMYHNHRCFRWGNGQNKPRLEDQLLPFDMRKVQSCHSVTEEPAVHYLATTEDGQLVAWGNNNNGQLGVAQVMHPQQVDRNTNSPAGENVDIRKISSFHLKRVHSPMFVQYFEDSGIFVGDVACGSDFSAAVSDEGALFVWGNLDGFDGEGAKLRRISAKKRASLHSATSTPSYSPSLTNRMQRKRSSQLTILSTFQSLKEHIPLQDEATPPKRVPGVQPGEEEEKSQREFSQDSELEDLSVSNEAHENWPTWAKRSVKQTEHQRNPFASEPEDNQFVRNPFAEKTFEERIAGDHSSLADADESSKNFGTQVHDDKMGEEHGGLAKFGIHGQNSLVANTETKQEVLNGGEESSGTGGNQGPGLLQTSELDLRIRSELASDPNSNSGSTMNNMTENTSTPSSTAKAAVRLEIPKDIQDDEMQFDVGQRVDLISRGRGIVKFIGSTEFASGVWVGVELDDKTGKNNGTVKGVSYFQTDENRGVFVRPRTIHIAPLEAAELNTAPTSSSTESAVQDLSSSSSESSSESDISEVDLSEQQLDDQENSIYREPMFVASLRRVMAVSCVCGEQFMAVLDKQGRMFTWGENDFGQLGLGDDEPRNTPSLVSGLKKEAISMISAGAEFMLALSSGSQPLLYSWGRNMHGQLGRFPPLGRNEEDGDYFWEDDVFSIPTALWGQGPVPGTHLNLGKVVCIAAGVSHAALVNSDGELYTWGCGSSGQLGHGEAESTGRPRKVVGLSRAGEDVHVVSVTCGQTHTVALTDSRIVYSWGGSRGGMLGHGSMTQGNESKLVEPKVISALTGRAVEAIYSNAHSTFAISAVENPQDGL